MQVNVLGADVQPTKLFLKLKQLYETSFANLNSWLEALDGLVYPEHRFKYWIQILSDLLTQTGNQVPIAKLQEIIKLMIADVGSLSKPMIGEQIGSYNRKFAQNWRKILVDKFGEHAQNVTDVKRLTQQL